LPHTIKNILADYCEPLKDNIFFIDADSKISSFDLYPIVDLGIVHSSRSGCELAMYGKPVILVADNHFRGKGFVIDVSSEKEFYENIEKIFHSPESDNKIEERIELSRKYWLLYQFHGFIDFGLFRGGWGKPVELLFGGLADFLPGRNEKLDYICDAILSGKPIFGDHRWPPVSL